MNGKKARALRKSLGMTTANLKEKDLKTIGTVKKIVYFRNRAGGLVPTESVRPKLTINTNLHHYRQAKKALKNK
jgi:hypothetical protein